MFASVMYIPIGLSGAIFSMFSVIVGFICGVMFLHEETTKTKLVSMGIAVFGACWVMYAVLNGENNNVGNCTSLDSPMYSGSSEQSDGNHIDENILMKHQSEVPYLHDINKMQEEFHKFNNTKTQTSSVVNDLSDTDFHNLNITRHSGCTQLTEEHDLMQHIIGMLLGAAGGINNALLGFFAKMITNKDGNIHHTEITFWNGALQSILSATVMLFIEDVVISMSIDDWLLVFGHAAFAALLIMSYYIGLYYGELYLLSLTLTAEIPMRVFVQFVAFTQLQPETTGWVDIVGASVVTLGIIILPIGHLLGNQEEKKVHSTEDCEQKALLD